MALHVHRSNRLERLVDVLVDELAVPSGDPMCPETVVVQSRGMAEWVRLAVAARTGVSAHLDFPTPRRVLEGVLGQACDATPESVAAWQRDRVAWSLMSLLPEWVGHADFAPLSTWLSPEGAGEAEAIALRWQLAGRIAHTFDQYAVYRPDMVLAWCRGQGLDDLSVADRWQPLLFRALVDALGDGHVASLASRYARRTTPLPTGRGLGPGAGVPARLFLFGISTLPPLYVGVLGHLAHQIPVHLHLLSPSAEYWGDVRDRWERRRLRRRHDPDRGEETERLLHLDEGHALLAALGRVGRDFQDVLLDQIDEVADPIDLHVPTGGGSALRVLQDDILGVVRREAHERVPIADDDRSLQVHGCHSPAREVEVLRDRLLDLLEADPTLRPRDIVVLTPDITEHGPLVDAVFGVEPGDPLFLPYTIADRPVAVGNEVARALLDLLGLVRSRLTAPDVLDLLAHAPVRARFGFGDDDVAAVEQLVAEAGIRWGRDADHRARCGQPEVDQNTWRFGLDRLLLGHAMVSERPVHGRVPMPDIEGAASDLIGRLLDFVRLVDAAVRDLVQPRDLPAWRQTLRSLLVGLVGEEDEAGEIQRLRDRLDEVVDAAVASGWQGQVPLRVVADLLEERLLEERRTGAFLRAGITFCEMLPMRSIPARVVALLGLSDGAFPRADARLGFDLLKRAPKPGDRSKRHDDRYLVLEALVSARDALLVTYVSHDVKDNKPLPPSVVLADVLDAFDATFLPPEGAEAARDRLVVHHPLQPFSTAYVSRRARKVPSWAADRLFTFDARAAQGASALQAGRVTPEPFLRGPLPLPEPLREVDLGRLVRFFDDPVLWFLERRLGVGRPDDAVVLDDREPFALDGLDEWKVGERMLQLHASGVDWGEARAILEGEGMLPLGQRANPLLARVSRRVAGIVSHARSRLDEPKVAPLGLDLPLGDVRLTGRVGGLHTSARLALGYASVREGTHRLRLWVHHLALQVAAGPRDPRASELYGRQGDRTGLMVAYPALDPAQAAGHLGALVALYDHGQERPLRFLPDAAWAWVCERRTGGTESSAAYKANRAADAVWERGGRGAEAWVRLVGQGADLTAPVDEGPGFADVAEAVFGPAWQWEVA